MRQALLLPLRSEVKINICCVFLCVLLRVDALSPPPACFRFNVEPAARVCLIHLPERFLVAALAEYHPRIRQGFRGLFHETLEHMQS